MNSLYDESLFLEHHGIKGQKWGVRRFQNPDGTLTAAGKRRLQKRSRYELRDALSAQFTDQYRLRNKKKNVGARLQKAEDNFQERMCKSLSKRTDTKVYLKKFKDARDAYRKSNFELAKKQNEYAYFYIKSNGLNFDDPVAMSDAEDYSFKRIENTQIAKKNRELQEALSKAALDYATELYGEAEPSKLQTPAASGIIIARLKDTTIDKILNE